MKTSPSVPERGAPSIGTVNSHENSRSAALPGASASAEDAGEFAWPVAGGEVLSAFGVPRRHHRHAGIDIRGAEGQDVLAASRGEVSYCGNSPGGYGKLVILDHGAQTFSLYGDLLDVAVKQGARVDHGQPVGSVGATASGAPGLYFELRVDGQPVDPLQWLKKR